jgi:cytochrome c biogenesis protein CcdA
VIDTSLLGLAFAAGMVATINPCGFAMLPAYLSYFLGIEDPSRDARSGVLRALAVGFSVSAGFLLVFFLLGIPFAEFARSIQGRLPLVTAVIGTVLVGLGIAMLKGFEPVLNLPKLQKGTGSRELPTMFLFGVSYAVSSLSCTIPIFLSVMAGAFTQDSFAQSLSTFVAYGAGMALVLMALTLAIALARQGLVRSLRRVLPYVNRIAGGLLIVAGGYLAYYGWYEHQVLENNASPGGPAAMVTRWNDALRGWIQANDPRRIGLILLAAILLALIAASGWRANRTARR